MALSTVLMGALLASPFINVLAARGGARWLGSYAVVAAMGLAAAAVASAFALTIVLFRSIGPRRTRFVAQIVAAMVGAVFMIGLQVGAILSYDSLSRFDLLRSEGLVAIAPDIGSIFYWPARAMLGDETALAAVLSVGLILLGISIVMFSPRFGDHAIAAAGVSSAVTRQHRWPTSFRTATPDARIAAEGVDAAQARSLADVADADANPVPAAAGLAALAAASATAARCSSSCRFW